MIIFTCGLSRSGKTTLIGESMPTDAAVKHVRASTVLKENKRPIWNLCLPDMIENQRVLVGSLKQSLDQNSDHIILDGHLLIETIDGPQLVPDSILSALPLLGIITVRSAANVIAERRKGTQLTTSHAEIEDLANIEILQASRLARHRRVRHIVVDASEKAAFESAVKQCLSALH